MSSIESDTATSCQSSETAETSPAADVHCPRRPSSSGVAARKREQDALGRKVYGQHSKAKLQKLQEKVKVHQQYVEETIKAQPWNTTLSPTTTSTAGNSIFPPPAMQNDPGLAADFFMTPPKHFVSDCTPFRTRVPDEGAFLNSLQSPATYTYATPFSSWNTLPGAYDPQEPLTPGPSCLASDILTGFTMEDPFCSAQNLQGLHADNGTQSLLSPEHARVAQGDSGVHANTPESSQGRVRYVIEQAAAVGFETLDEAVAAYYTETFENMPALYQEQRLSRNRRLPRLLNTLQSAAKGWSEWERRGFQEQITVGAEELLVQELNTFITQQRLGADGNKSANNDMGEARIESTDNMMMRSQQVQNDVSAAVDWPQKLATNRTGFHSFQTFGP
ncbi:hypothetical protein B0J13DRAFT_630226 [Dactylonectria estremocensis]|uniref:BZIP domain-containing protein n=1 Tax=Dactylonectria estremocensis TaxID=1079267 RepID=A0A9P9DCT5_9HYPO|nr:hypothetical protein B0J13DRAFT_630226 [Dactylonectria estremocensis]